MGTGLFRTGLSRGPLARLAAAMLLLGLALPAAARASVCDYSGFEQPCKVNGGAYRALVPEGEGPFPVMIYLYGSGGRSVTISSHPLFQQAIVERGYILLVPAALEMTYGGGVRETGWSLRNEAQQPRDEIAFLRRVIADAARRFPVDRSRILFAGQSRGGFLTWEIACHAPDLGSAFAAHAAGYLGPLPQRCQRPVRLLHTQGISDPIVPLTRRESFSGGAELPALSESLDMISRTNECRASGLEGEGSDFFGFERRSWSGCRSGGSLDLMLHPGGHGMPWIWFRAVLDWFEETPDPAPVNKPVTRTLGAERPEGLFKRPPVAASPGTAPAE